MGPKKKKAGDRPKTPGKVAPPPPPPKAAPLPRSALLRKMLSDVVGNDNKSQLGKIAEECAHEIEDDLLI